MAKNIPMVAALLLLMGSSAVADEKYPSRDIHLINPTPAGSGSDIVTRWLAERIKKASGQTVIVENKPGAGALLATEYTARAKPDGYTILMAAGNNLAANQTVLKNPPIDVRSQIVVAGTLNRQAITIAVRADRPWKTLPELTRYLKERGQKATYGASTVASRILGELYQSKAGLDGVQVVYQTSNAMLNEIQSGHLDFVVVDSIFASKQHRDGKLRVLGVSTPTRMNAMPDFPTMKESGYDISFMAWFGLFVPSATPGPVVSQINKWLGEIMTTEEAKTFVQDVIGGDPMVTSPGQANELLRQDVKDWVGYVDLAKIERM